MTISKELVFVALATIMSSVSAEICSCGTSSGCCNVDASVDFTNVAIVPYTFPYVSLSGDYTLIDNVAFDSVIKYTVTDASSFLNNVKIFPVDSATALDCSQSYLYMNDVQVAMTEISSGTGTYCEPILDNVFTATELSNTTGIYFALNDLVTEGSQINFLLDSANPITTTSATVGLSGGADQTFLEEHGTVFWAVLIPSLVFIFGFLYWWFFVRKAASAAASSSRTSSRVPSSRRRTKNVWADLGA